MIIDFHTHTFPENLAKRAIEKLENLCKRKTVGDGTQQDLICQMDNAGVDISVVAPVATSSKQVEGINRNLIKNQRIITLGAMHPDFMDIESEVKFLKQNNVKGIKLHPDYQNFRADDKKLFELYEQLMANDIFILFHAGVDIGLPSPYGGCPEMIKVVANNFPMLKIIAAHFGGFKMWDDVLDNLAGINNIWFDTAFCADEMEDSIFYKILNKHGAEKILMATDWPWAGAKNTITWLLEKQINASQLDLILGENARVLLNI